jgi:putative CocE/NonD family hydrolase
MVEDQRFAARRPDVLVYESGPLAEDLRVAGPLTATLYVSTTGTDADWVVKLIDVLPDDTKNPEPNPRQVRLGGYQMMVRGDVIRGKFRNSLAKPEPFEPGRVTKVEFELQDVFHRFSKGHRVMVQVQSTWFPKIDRNPQTFVDIYSAKAEDFRKATHRVYSSTEYPSALRVSVVP